MQTKSPAASKSQLGGNHEKTKAGRDLAVEDGSRDEQGDSTAAASQGSFDEWAPERRADFRRRPSPARISIHGTNSTGDHEDDHDYRRGSCTHAAAHNHED